MPKFFKVILPLIFILTAGIVINLLPYVVSKSPASLLLSSDAKQHVTFWHSLLDTEKFTKDVTLTRFAVPGQKQLHLFLAQTGNFFRLPLELWSIFLSFLMLCLFLTGLYFLLYISIQNRLITIVITCFCIIPIHILGNMTWGFQASGFLPRDFAQALGYFILFLYFLAIQKQNKFLFACVAFLCGAATNLYIGLFPHLFITLALAEIFRQRRWNNLYLLYSLLFSLGAFPIIIEFLKMSSQNSPIDLEILRNRYNYVMLFPLTESGLQYLRRFLTYVALFPVILYFLKHLKPQRISSYITPWTCLAFSGLCISIIGLLIENLTSYTQFWFTRASAWFFLSTMVLIATIFTTLGKHKWGKKGNWFAWIAISTVFVLQSNIPTVYRYIMGSIRSEKEFLAFDQAIQILKQVVPKDALILAPTTEMEDIAHDVRTYSLRSVYVAYKDGGVSILDGQKARIWWKRYHEVYNLFQSQNILALLKFMEQKNIDFAFVPTSYYKDSDPLIKNNSIIAATEKFLILEKPLTTQ